MDYFLELFGSLPRAGPGDSASTRKAFGMMDQLPEQPRILDLGCGPGVHTVELLSLCDGTVVAVDLLPHMIQRVISHARAAGVDHRLQATQMDMNDLSFAADSFDIVWCESAIYILGFQKGLQLIQPLLKPSGYLAVSEAVWLKADPPPAVREFWQAYPEIDTVENKLAHIRASGFQLVDHFVLPDSSWTELYYDPLAEKLEYFQDAWSGLEEAQPVLEEARNELAIFRQYSEFYGYAFFVCQK